MVFDHDDQENLKSFTENINKICKESELFLKLSKLEQVMMTSNPIVFKFWIARDKNNEKAVTMWENSVEFRSKYNLRDPNLSSEFNEYIESA